MNVAVITPCIYPSRDFIRLLDESAYRQGIDLIPFGIGEQFLDWRRMLMNHTVPKLRELKKDYTHVLYVDGNDCVFISTLSEIAAKYLAIGAPPCLISHDSQSPSLSKFHVNAGCYMGEIGFIVDLWEMLDRKFPQEGDYQQWVQNDWPFFGMECDVECLIFQSVERELLISNGRVFNPDANSFPCVLHFRGGYSDPVTGRQDRIRPVWRQLYGA